MLHNRDLKPEPDWPQWVTPGLINWMIDITKRHPSRTKYLGDAREFRRWYRGNRFLAPMQGQDDMTIDDRNATSRRNIIGETVDELGSVLLKNNPMVRRRPYLPHHIDLADDLDSMWLWQWLECNGQSIYSSMMEDAQLTGLATCKVIWDPFVGYPGRQGVIRLIPLPEGSVLVDPYASNNQRGRDARFIIHHARKFPEEIIAKFRRRGALAMGYTHAGAGSWNYANDMLGLTNYKLTQPLGGPGNLSAQSLIASGTNTNSDSPNDPLEGHKKDLYEAWIFPRTMYANDTLSRNDLKIGDYKYGLVATMVDSQIVDIQPNPLFKRKRLSVQDDVGAESTKVMEVGPKTHPFIFLWWKRSADEQGNRQFYHCMSMVEWMTSTQFNYNAIKRNVAIIARTLANPAMAYNKDHLAMDPSNIKMIPGQMFPVEGVQRVSDVIQPLYPQGIPTDLVGMLRQDEDAIRQIGGIRPGLVGLFPDAGGTSHTPMGTIGTLQEGAFGPLWRYVRELDNSLVDLSTVMDGLIQLKYEPGHYMATSRRGRQFYLEWTGEHSVAQFQRKVVAGATTPVYDLEKEQRQAAVMQLTRDAVLSNDPRVVRLALIYTRSLYNFPWAEQYEQELQAELMRLEQVTQGLQQIGARDVGNQMSQTAIPEQAGGGTDLDTEGVEALFQQLGVSPEQLGL